MVITSVIFLARSFSNLRSLLVTIPLRIPSLSITGMPPILYSLIRFIASPTVAFRLIVMGSNIITFSALLTLLTWAACFSTDMFLWITPIPPSRAMAIASSSSVTVSIADDTTGVLMRMFLVNNELRSTSLGSISEYEGIRSTSSKVNPSYKIFSSMNDICIWFIFLLAQITKKNRTLNTSLSFTSHKKLNYSYYICVECKRK